jgi:glycosyltransferase involved in cell wall biosynthesis
VVSTEAGGVPAILTHGAHGLLAPMNDHEALGRHVLALLEDPATAGRYVRAARESCVTSSWTAVRQQWLRAYRSVLATSPARAAAFAQHQ